MWSLPCVDLTHAIIRRKTNHRFGFLIFGGGGKIYFYGGGGGGEGGKGKDLDYFSHEGQAPMGRGGGISKVGEGEVNPRTPREANIFWHTLLSFEHLPAKLFFFSFLLFFLSQVFIPDYHDLYY